MIDPDVRVQRRPCRRAAGVGLGLVVLILGTAAGVEAQWPTRAAAGPSRAADHPAAKKSAAIAPPAASAARTPRGFLIYLIHRDDPIVVSRYTRENDEVVFEKFGGEVRIPAGEVARIAPDEPEDSAWVPRPAVLPTIAAAPSQGSRLYLAMRGGKDFNVTGLESQRGGQVKVSVADGSFTVPRSDILGLVRLPTSSEVAEAWLSIDAGALGEDEGPAESRAAAGAGAPSPGATVGPPRDAPFPYSSSERPHLLRLTNGQSMRAEAFWIEDGIVEFRRLGGIVTLPRSEVAAVIPEQTAPLEDHMPVRFIRQLGRDLLEVQAQGGPHQVRLVGVDVLEQKGEMTETPWRYVERGATVFLEFDRQQTDTDGRWLAYVFLPNGRMLNAELVRLGLARPRAVAGNVRYLDLFEELASRTPAR